MIALGGMNRPRGRRLASFGAYGWAGIDAWSVSSEAERGPDIDGLAVAAIVAGQRLEAVAGDAIAGAGGDIEVAGDRISPADIELDGLILDEQALDRPGRARRRPRPGR